MLNRRKENKRFYRGISSNIITIRKAIQINKMYTANRKQLILCGFSLSKIVFQQKVEIEVSKAY